MDAEMLTKASKEMLALEALMDTEELKGKLAIFGSKARSKVAHKVQKFREVRAEKAAERARAERPEHE